MPTHAEALAFRPGRGLTSLLMETGTTVQITIFFVSILVAITGFFIKRKVYSKPDKNSFTPAVHVARLVSDGVLYATIQNVGNEPIKNLHITMNRQAGGKTDSRSVTRFFNANENPVLATGHSCDFLNISETKKMASIPQTSEDNKMLFIVDASGVNSNTGLRKEFPVTIRK